MNGRVPPRYGDVILLTVRPDLSRLEDEFAAEGVLHRVHSEIEPIRPHEIGDGGHRVGQGTVDGMDVGAGLQGRGKGRRAM